MRWRIQVVPGRASGSIASRERQRAGDVQGARALREDVGHRHDAGRELQREFQRVGREAVILPQQQRRGRRHGGCSHARAREHEVLRRAIRIEDAEMFQFVEQAASRRGKRNDVRAGRHEVRLGQQIKTRRAPRARIRDAIVVKFRRAQRIEGADANGRGRVAGHAYAAVARKIGRGIDAPVSRGGHDHNALARQALHRLHQRIREDRLEHGVTERQVHNPDAIGFVIAADPFERVDHVAGVAGAIVAEDAQAPRCRRPVRCPHTSRWSCGRCPPRCPRREFRVRSCPPARHCRPRNP